LVQEGSVPNACASAPGLILENFIVYSPNVIDTDLTES